MLRSLLHFKLYMLVGFRRGNVHESYEAEIFSGHVLRSLTHGETYRYLGVIKLQS